MKDDDYLLTVNEAADELRISPHTLCSWVSQKRITCKKIGRRVRLRLSVIDSFIGSNTIEARKPVK